MKKMAIFTTAVLLAYCWSVAGLNTEIFHSVENVQDNRWIYTYQVHNIALEEGISEFTIWFELSKYENLAVESIGVPAGWVESVWQPMPALLDDGGYDVLSLTENISAGQSLSGFQVAFDWIGDGVPGVQSYEIINPDTFETIETGYTVLVPEPASAMIMILGAAWAGIKRKR